MNRQSPAILMGLPAEDWLWSNKLSPTACLPPNKALSLRKGGRMPQARHHQCQAWTLGGGPPMPTLPAPPLWVPCWAVPSPLPTWDRGWAKEAMGLVSEALLFHLGGLCVEQGASSFPTGLQQ